MAKSKGRKIFGILLIVASIGSLYFVPWIIVRAWIRPLPDTVQEEIEADLDYGYDGILVYIDQTGKEAQFLGAGWHERDQNIPAKPEALFKIASIGKLYDVVIATKLAGRGQLSLDKTLAEYMPELKGRIENAERITLRQMIQHRSGIPNFSNVPNYWSDPPKTFEGNLALILDKPANFEPGEDYEYCNTNYMLLNRIVDQTLGYPKFDFLCKEVLEPHGLLNTYANLEEVELDRVMSGYHQGYSQDLKEDEYGMLATAEDVGVFLRALNDGSLFEGKEAEIYAGLYEYEHGGWVPGYMSFAEYHKDLDAVIVVFYNTTDSKLYLWNVSEVINNRIAKILKSSS